MTASRTMSALAATAMLASTALTLTTPAAHAAGTGVIRGTVLETGHSIAPGIDVSLYRTNGEFIDATVTDSSAGAYQFTGLDEGGYVLWFENQNQAVTEWYDNQPDQEHAATISLQKGQTYFANAYLTLVSENLTKPTVSGTPAVGSTLTATGGTWYPTQGVTFSYQWMRGTSAIQGATAATYLLREDDAGYQISVRRTAMVQGMTESADSTATACVTRTAPLVATNLVAPTISGDTAVGSTLTATAGTWTPSDATVSLEWLRGSTPVGTGPTYTTTSADVGSSLKVRASANKSCWSNGSAESASFGPINTPTTAPPAAVAPANKVKPTTTGTSRVGGTLTASPGTWSTTASHTYRWTRNGRTIPRATARTYRLTAADARAKVGVVVTATNSAGSASAVSTTRVVAKATSRLSVTAKSAKKGRLTVKTTLTSVGARTGRVTVTVKVGKKTKVKRFALSKGTRTVTLTGLRRGTATVRVTYAGNTSTNAAKATKKARVR